MENIRIALTSPCEVVILESREVSVEGFTVPLYLYILPTVSHIKDN